jgi:hypothetical protein
MKAGEREQGPVGCVGHREHENAIARKALIADVDRAGGPAAKREPSGGSPGEGGPQDSRAPEARHSLFVATVLKSGAAPPVLINVLPLNPALPRLGLRLATGPPALGEFTIENLPSPRA